MLHITLANDRQRRQIVHEAGPIEFGRLPKPGCEQIVVDDPYTSREQLRLEELPTGDVRIHNFGSPHCSFSVVRTRMSRTIGSDCSEHWSTKTCAFAYMLHRN